jgi:hypothetical protein
MLKRCKKCGIITKVENKGKALDGIMRPKIS